MRNYIMSIDAETNGLYGQAFCIGATLHDTTKDNKVVDKFLARCPLIGKLDPFVLVEVLPELADISQTDKTYPHMLENFASWYSNITEKIDDLAIIGHVIYPVEAKLFLDCVEYGFLTKGPFPFIDISAFPEIGISVDSYLALRNIDVPWRKSVHNPVYDSIAAATAYYNYMKNRG